MTTTYTWWFIQHQIMCQVNNWKMNLCRCLSLEMLWTVCKLSRLKQFMDHCLSSRIMVLLEKMQTNYSVPCHKGDGSNTLATRYNNKIILIYDTYWVFFLTLKYYLTLSPPIEIIPYKIYKSNMPQSRIYWSPSFFLQIVDGNMPYSQLICWKVVLTLQICLNVSSVKGYVYINSYSITISNQTTTTWWPVANLLSTEINMGNLFSKSAFNDCFKHWKCL